jgi:hypothetical protein
MKNVLLIFGIGILIIGMPLATSINTSIMTHTNLPTTTAEKQTSIIRNTNQPPTTDEPPNWANGNFSGVWGYDIWGQYNIPIGWMFGYYRHDTNFGYFYAGFAEFGHENISWYIKGYFFGPFMFGSLGKNESANTTIFVGIGRYNETNYHWRVMGEIGPIFFMDGTYTRFN